MGSLGAQKEAHPNKAAGWTPAVGQCQDRFRSEFFLFLPLREREREVGWLVPGSLGTVFCHRININTSSVGGSFLATRRMGMMICNRQNIKQSSD